MYIATVFPIVCYWSVASQSRAIASPFLRICSIHEYTIFTSSHLIREKVDIRIDTYKIIKNTNYVTIIKDMHMKFLAG